MIPKSVSVITSKLKPQGMENSQDMVPEGQIPDHIEVLKAISEDLLQGITSRDPHRIAEALAEFWGAMQEADEQEDLLEEPSDY